MADQTSYVNINAFFLSLHCLPNFLAMKNAKVTRRHSLRQKTYPKGIKFHDFDHFCEILYLRKVSKPQNREIKYLPSLRFSFS